MPLPRPVWVGCIAALFGCGGKLDSELSAPQGDSGVEDVAIARDSAVRTDSAVVADSAVAADTATLVDSATIVIDSAVPPPRDASPATGFAGNFSCNLSYTVMVIAPIMTTQMQMQAAGMTSTETGTTVTASFSGAFACTLTFEDMGNNTAVLNPADTQTCNLTVMGFPVTLTFDMGGTAILATPSLKADNIPISVKDGPGGMLGIKGTGTFNADCTKM